MSLQQWSAGRKDHWRNITTGIAKYSTHMRQKDPRAKTFEESSKTARSADASRSGVARRRLARVKVIEGVW